MRRVPTQGRGVGGGGPGPCLASCCPTQRRETVLGTSSHGTAAHSAPGLSHLLWDSVSSLQPCSRRSDSILQTGDRGLQELPLGQVPQPEGCGLRAPDFSFLGQTAPWTPASHREAACRVGLVKTFPGQSPECRLPSFVVSLG